jgi:hypothetical protein
MVTVVVSLEFAAAAGDAQLTFADGQQLAGLLIH